MSEPNPGLQDGGLNLDGDKPLIDFGESLFNMNKVISTLKDQSIR